MWVIGSLHELVLRWTCRNSSAEHDSLSPFTVLPGCLSLTNKWKRNKCLHTVTTWKSSMIVGTHLGSPWGELSQTSCHRRWVCTWLFRTHNTQWQEFLSLRQPLALDGGERIETVPHIYMLRLFKWLTKYIISKPVGKEVFCLPVCEWGGKFIK